MAAREAVVVCGERMSDGVTVWDAETGEELLRLPTCASPPNGLICIRKDTLVASQLQNHRPCGSGGGGAIFFWTLGKPQVPYRSYTIETIEPIACTKDGIYLVGGAPSGNAYIWEVPSGRLLKTWHAHQRSLKCLAFSQDGSFLISGSEDGTLSVWLMISLLSIADPHGCGSLSSFDAWSQDSEHSSSITGLLPLSCGSNLRFMSSSLDGTCKVWDLVSGMVLHTFAYPVSVTAIAVDPGEQLLFAGCNDGKIYINVLDIGMEGYSAPVAEGGPEVLCGHKTSIASLAFSKEGSWLVSSSVDCIACLWDANNWQAIQRFSLGKGHITNLVVIPRSSLSATENQRSCLRPHLLEKSLRTNLETDGTLTLLPQHCSRDDHLVSFRSATLLNKQILDLEHERTPEAIQMKVDTSTENRKLAIDMTKNMTAINKHLQTQLVDMMQERLCHDSKVAQSKRRKAKANGSEEQAKHPA